MFQEPLGSGTYGTVFASNLNKNPVVVKVLRGDFQNNEKYQKEFKKEAALSCRLRHPNIVASFGVVNPTMLVMQRESISLLQLLNKMEAKGQQFTPAQVSKLCTDCCMGMNFLHLQGYVHRDMNLGNFLLSSAWTLKISDFGTAAYLGTMQSKLSHVGMGAEAFKPIEALNTIYQPSSDIWGFGIVMSCLCTSSLSIISLSPTKSATDILAEQIAGLRPDERFQVHCGKKGSFLSISSNLSTKD